MRPLGELSIRFLKGPLTTGPWQKSASPFHIPGQPPLVQAMVPCLYCLHSDPGMLNGFRASLFGSIPSSVMGVTHQSAAFSPVEQTHSSVVLPVSMEPYRR